MASNIYYGKNADPAIKFAAGDMARCLTAISGNTYRDAAEGPAAAGDVVLAFDPKLGEQEWRLSARDGKLFIEGRDRAGIVYGIYTFLEKYANCSWLAPDTELLPKQAGWKIPQVNETGKPAFLRREMFVGNDFMDGFWRLRNKENNRAAYINFSCGSPRDCHTFDIYVKAVKDAKKPELFGPDKSGRPCVTLCMTNPEVRRIVLEELLKYIARDRSRAKAPPYPRIYDVSQPDGGDGGQCWCDSCRKLAEAEGSYSGPNLDFVNYLAREVSAKYPDVLIRTFAYSYTTVPPKTLKAEKNVVVRFCAGWIFNPLPETKHAKMLEEWGRHADHISIWSYWRTYKGSLFPQVKKRAHIAEEIRMCRKNNVSMYYAENENPLSRSFAMMQHWLMLKMLENPDQDIFRLSEKFISGYYGKAAPAILKYLDYLEKREEESRAFMDREFYETVNGLLDEAENLARGDERSLSHIRWERSVVDRSIYENLASLRKAGYNPDMKRISKRFAACSQEVIRNWSSLDIRPQIKKDKLKAARLESELYQHFPVEIPAQFDGCDVIDLHWPQIKITSWGKTPEYVKDPDAVCGTAFYNPALQPKIPYGIGYYNGSLKSGGGISLGAGDIPQDGKFHLYKLGRTFIMVPLFIHFDDTWRFRSYLSTVGIIPEERDIWVSMKFTGPRFIPGTKGPNRVLFDRLLLVKDPQPLRHYKPVDPSKNLLKNPGFEKSVGKWISGWGRITEKCLIDTTEKHSGKSSLKIGNSPNGYVALYCNLPDLDKLNSDLLIRGWYKYQGITAENLPFIGLWTLTGGGKNGYSTRLASFFPGNYDWQYFEKVVSAADLKKAVSRTSPDAKRLTFRINIAGQSGWVWLDDLEVIPLEKK